jgi:hypothetical protein
MNCKTAALGKAEYAESPNMLKDDKKNTMQLPKISNIIYFFILPVDAVVKTGGKELFKAKSVFIDK